MSDSIDRRSFVKFAAATGLSTELAGRVARAEAVGPGALASLNVGAPPRQARSFLTEARDFVDVSRGKPKPFTLRGEALERARLTPRTWRLEIVGDDSSQVARPNRLEAEPPSTWPGSRSSASGTGSST